MDATCISLIAQGRRERCLVGRPFLLWRGNTVTAESLFAAAAKDATEAFFGSHPVSFLAFFVGIVLLVSFLDVMVLFVINSVG